MLKLSVLRHMRTRAPKSGPRPAGAPTPDAEIRALQLQLRQAQKQASLGMLASSVAHEFNNIMTAVVNQTDFALRRGTPEAMDKALHKIQVAAERATAVCNSMLGHAANRAAKVAPADVGALLEETLTLLGKDLSKHQVRLETRIKSQWPVRVDANQIQQVFLNLILNARQAMPSGGTLTISVTDGADGRSVDVRITDTGVGIPPEKLENIFEPFFTTRADGTGLGLAVSHDIVSELGGDLRVESVVGQGTTMIVSLPRAQSQSQPAEDSARKIA